MTRAEQREQWEGLVREQAESGKNARVFCEERGLAVGVFYRWRRRLAADKVGTAAESFVEVVARNEVAGVRLRVTVDGAAEFYLDRGFDETTFRRAFAVVAG